MAQLLEKTACFPRETLAVQGWGLEGSGGRAKMGKKDFCWGVTARTRSGRVAAQPGY